MAKSLVLFLLLCLALPAGAQASLEIQLGVVGVGRLGRLSLQVRNRSGRTERLQLPAGAAFEGSSGAFFLAEPVDLEVPAGGQLVVERLVIPLTADVVSGPCQVSLNPAYTYPVLLTNRSLRLAPAPPPLALIMAVWPVLRLTGQGQSYTRDQAAAVMAQVRDALGNDPARIEETRAWGYQIEKLLPEIRAQAQAARR